MGKVVFDITMSLDGFVTGPRDDIAHPLGEGGEPLHDWISGASTDDDAAVLGELLETTGAVVAGRRTYDNAQGANGWGEGPLGSEVPVFVVTHDVPPGESGGAVFTFVTDGIESALARARAAAATKGADKNVYVMGGANIGRQYLAAGLLDEVQIHLVPILLGDGVRMFEPSGLEHVKLARVRVVDTPSATHLRYRVVR